MKKHKRKALRKAFTAVFFLTLIALALVAYGLLCWRAGQYKISESKASSGETFGGNANRESLNGAAHSGVSSNLALSAPLTNHESEVMPHAGKYSVQVMPAVQTSGKASHTEQKKHPTTASGASSNPMPGYPEKWADPKQSVDKYRNEDRSMQ